MSTGISVIMLKGTLLCRVRHFWGPDSVVKVYSPEAQGVKLRKDLLKRVASMTGTYSTLRAMMSAYFDS